uniref:Uncharacterized protein n=1 Tax=Oryza sativa subsp. japonica TaxID=39947 RepID=Q69IS4_ORYSJ|nr:hypothetical protein [Oryza sativa Japonica Group]BAD62542.1 hypothetical protein [Oryza sativa Japonica Group]
MAAVAHGWSSPESSGGGGQRGESEGGDGKRGEGGETVEESRRCFMWAREGKSWPRGAESSGNGQRHGRHRGRSGAQSRHDFWEKRGESVLEVEGNRFHAVWERWCELEEPESVATWAAKGRHGGFDSGGRR